MRMHRAFSPLSIEISMVLFIDQVTRLSNADVIVMLKDDRLTTWEWSHLLPWSNHFNSTSIPADPNGFNRSSVISGHRIEKKRENRWTEISPKASCATRRSEHASYSARAADLRLAQRMWPRVSRCFKVGAGRSAGVKELLPEFGNTQGQKTAGSWI